MLQQSHPDEAKFLLEEAQRDVRERWKLYKTFAGVPVNGNRGKG